MKGVVGEMCNPFFDRSGKDISDDFSAVQTFMNGVPLEILQNQVRGNARVTDMDTASELCDREERRREGANRRK